MLGLMLMALQTANNMLQMWPDFRKPTKLSHLVFREIPILNIQATVVPLCYIVALLNILYNWNSLLASVL